ncbi:MAG: phosphatidate cytidylyltransferase [Gemmatimonadota bacterium]|nr:phosphatidate cytidylyltransferase [Gemmatimonadota bacterium]
MSPNDGEVRRRFTAAAILIPLFLVAVVLGGAFFLAAILMLTAAGAWELFGMTMTKPYRARRLAGTGLALAFPSVLYLAPMEPLVVPALIAAGIVGIALAQLLDPRGEEALASVAVTVTGAAYVGLLLGHQILIRELPRDVPGAPYWFGALLLGVPIVLTWANDTAAYFLGHRFGERKLLARVSPGKSLEGAVGALAVTVLLALPTLWAVNLYTKLFGIGDAIAIGALVGLAAPCGDLVESSFKRDTGVKDSSRLIPGHGGVLDRFDAMLVTVPVYFYYVRGVVL